MNRNLTLALAFVFLFALMRLLAQPAAQHPNGKGKQKPATQVSSADMARGQKVFEQNCSRCHNAPLAIPPQIAGTVLRHMRVRASLSAADEHALLRFMNP